MRPNFCAYCGRDFIPSIMRYRKSIHEIGGQRVAVHIRCFRVHDLDFVGGILVDLRAIANMMEV